MGAVLVKRRNLARLKDVAAASGVTAATVSRILNKRTEGFSVRPEVRARVVESARRLAYRPDLVARSLRRSRTRVVGLLGLGVPANISEHTLAGLVEVLDLEGVTLSAGYAPSGMHPYGLPPWRIDGAVISGATSRADLEPVEEAGVPYVSINGWCGPNGSSVMFDDRKGCGLAMQHLLDLGHERIAYANAHGPWVTHPSVADRHRAYVEALKERSLSPLPGHDQPLPDPPDDFVARSVRESGATAILAYHHYHAVGILQAALRMGIRLPEEMSLACFNDEYPVAYLYPPLTVVALPVRECGERAARMLVERLGGERKRPARALLAERLVVRGSTATAKPLGRRRLAANRAGVSRK